MITNYDKFVRINEEKDAWGNESKGGLFSSLKNMFSKMLQNVSDEIKKPVDELNNKLGKTKDPKQIQTIIANYLKVHNDTLTKQMKTEAKDLPTLKKVISDNLNGMYASITAVSKTLGEDKFSFSEVFADSPATMKKLFDKNPKKFEGGLNDFVDGLIVNQAKQFPSYKEITPEDLTKAKTEDTEQKGEIKKATEAPKQGTEAPKQGTEAPKEEATDVNASINIKETEKLNEEAVAQVEPKVLAADFQKLKDSMKKWFDFAIYKKVNTTLKEEKAGGNKQQGTIEDKIKNIKSTTHPDSVTAIADALTKADKQKLMQVRDLLGLDVKSAPL